jgi:hypothetical protein
MNGCPLMCANLCETKFATSFGKTPYKREVLKLGKLMGHMSKNDELQKHFDEIEKCLSDGNPPIIDVIEKVVLAIYTNQLTRKAKRDTLQLDPHKF